VSETVISFRDLTVVQVLQNQAVVISDLQNHIFVLKHLCLVANGITGSYDMPAIVDQTVLPSLSDQGPHHAQSKHHVNSFQFLIQEFVQGK
jgi:hypothetical protein